MSSRIFHLCVRCNLDQFLSRLLQGRGRVFWGCEWVFPELQPEERQKTASEAEFMAETLPGCAGTFCLALSVCAPWGLQGCTLSV